MLTAWFLSGFLTAIVKTESMSGEEMSDLCETVVVTGLGRGHSEFVCWVVILLFGKLHTNIVAYDHTNVQVTYNTVQLFGKHLKIL